MSYSGSSDQLRRGVGLFFAALVAPPATVVFTMLVPAGSPLAPFLNGGGSLLGGLAIASLFALLFGFVGAAVFLGVAFRLVRQCTLVRAFVLAGVGAGLAHSMVGFAIRTAFWHHEAFDNWLPGFGAIALYGGFALMLGPDQASVIATFLASALAGALAGLVYARFN